MLTNTQVLGLCRRLQVLFLTTVCPSLHQLLLRHMLKNMPKKKKKNLGNFQKFLGIFRNSLLWLFTGQGPAKICLLCVWHDALRVRGTLSSTSAPIECPASMRTSTLFRDAYKYTGAWPLPQAPSPVPQNPFVLLCIDCCSDIHLQQNIRRFL